MPINPQQASALLQSGQITQATFDMITAANSPQPPPQANLPPFLAASNADTSSPTPPPFENSEWMGGQAMGTPPPVQPPSTLGPLPPGVDASGRMAYVPGPLSATAPPPGTAMETTPAPSLPPAPSIPAQTGKVEVGRITPARPYTSAVPAPYRGGGSSGMADLTKATNEGLDKQKAGLGNLSNIIAQRAVEEGDLRDQQRNEAEQQRVLDLASKQRETDNRDQLVNDRMSAVDDFRKAKVDPDQLSKERGPMGNLVAALAAGMGAFGASLTKGPNSALEILNSQRELNIRAQEAAVAKAGQGVNLADNAIAQYRQLTGDNEAARAALRSDLIGRQRDQIQAVASKYGNAVDQQKLTQSMQELDTEKAKNDAILKQRVEANAAQQAAAQGARDRAQQGKIADMSKDFILKGDDPVEAQRKAVAIVTGRVVGAGPLTSIPDHEHRTQRELDLSKRTVLVDGKPRTTVSPQAALDYKEYQDSAADIKQAFSTLRKAWADGDVGKYEAARGQILDSMPKFMLGSSASGPTKGQLAHTYSALIPEYKHWYTKEGLYQHRTDEAFDVVQHLINHREATMNATTFEGAGTPVPFTPESAGK